MEEQSILITASFLPLVAKSDDMAAVYLPRELGGDVPTRSPCVFAWEKILHIQRLAAPNKILSEFKEVIEHLQVLTKKKPTETLKKVFVHFGLGCVHV